MSFVNRPIIKLVYIYPLIVIHGIGIQAVIPCKYCDYIIFFFYHRKSTQFTIEKEENECIPLQEY